AAVKITRRTELFSWVQGVFQSVIAHEVLVCGLAFPGVNGLRFEWLGSYPIAPEPFAEMCSVDYGLMYRAIKAWRASGGAPLLVYPGAPDAAGEDRGEILRQVPQWCHANLLWHGRPGLERRWTAFLVSGRERQRP